MRKLALIFALMVFSPSAFATQQSTINPQLPAQNAPLTSSVVRGNFGAAYNDINNLYGLLGTTGKPAGASGQVQYNAGGVFGGASGFVWNGYTVGIGVNSPNAGSSLDIGQRTDSIILPDGSTAQRPTVPVVGMLRYNNNIQQVEAYYQGSWQPLGGGGGQPNGIWVTETGAAVVTETGGFVLLQ